MHRCQQTCAKLAQLTLPHELLMPDALLSLWVYTEEWAARWCSLMYALAVNNSMRSNGWHETDEAVAWCIAAAPGTVMHMLAAIGSLAVEEKVTIFASAEFTDNGSSARRGLGNKRKPRDRAAGMHTIGCYEERIGRLGHQD